MTVARRTTLFGDRPSRTAELRREVTLLGQTIAVDMFFLLCPTPA
jgi:hypothetical protein